MPGTFEDALIYPSKMPLYILILVKMPFFRDGHLQGIFGSGGITGALEAAALGKAHE